MIKRSISKKAREAVPRGEWGERAAADSADTGKPYHLKVRKKTYFGITPSRVRPDNTTERPLPNIIADAILAIDNLLSSMHQLDTGTTQLTKAGIIELVHGVNTPGRGSQTARTANPHDRKYKDGDGKQKIKVGSSCKLSVGHVSLPPYQMLAIKGINTGLDIQEHDWSTFLPEKDGNNTSRRMMLTSCSAS